MSRHGLLVDLGSALLLVPPRALPIRLDFLRPLFPKPTQEAARSLANPRLGIKDKTRDLEALLLIVVGEDTRLVNLGDDVNGVDTDREVDVAERHLDETRREAKRRGAGTANKGVAGEKGCE
jgi:hypothetical protein